VSTLGSEKEKPKAERKGIPEAPHLEAFLRNTYMANGGIRLSIGTPTVRPIGREYPPVDGCETRNAMVEYDVYRLFPNERVGRVAMARNRGRHVVGGSVFYEGELPGRGKVAISYISYQDFGMKAFP